MEEGAGPIVTIKKREAHSQNCVLAHNPGLMWSRYVADKMGRAGDGKMPWTGVPYDAFAYAAAANTAALGGYADWRIPNREELSKLIKDEGAAPYIDTTAFPSWPSDPVWDSTTAADATIYGGMVDFTYSHYIIRQNKTTATGYVVLVRGG